MTGKRLERCQRKTWHEMSWGLRKPCKIQQFFQRGRIRKDGKKNCCRIAEGQLSDFQISRLTEALLKVLAQPTGSRFGSWGSSGDQSGIVRGGDLTYDSYDPYDRVLISSTIHVFTCHQSGEELQQLQEVSGRFSARVGLGGFVSQTQ